MIFNGLPPERVDSATVYCAFALFRWMMFKAWAWLQGRHRTVRSRPTSHFLRTVALEEKTPDCECARIISRALHSREEQVGRCDKQFRVDLGLQTANFHKPRLQNLRKRNRSRGKPWQGVSNLEGPRHTTKNPGMKCTLLVIPLTYLTLEVLVAPTSGNSSLNGQVSVLSPVVNDRVIHAKGTPAETPHLAACQSPYL